VGLGGARRGYKGLQLATRHNEGPGCGYKHYCLVSLMWMKIGSNDITAQVPGVSNSPFIYMTAVNFQMIPQLLNCYDKHTNSSSSK
jgi:hypothetical protein